MSTYPIDFQDEDMDTTIEQQLTERLLKIAEDLYAREWSFNCLSSKTYGQLCDKGIYLLELLKEMWEKSR